MDEAMKQAIRRGVGFGAIKQAIKEGIETTLFRHKVYHDDIQIFTTAIMDTCRENIEALEPTGQSSPGCEWLADLIIGELDEIEKESRHKAAQTRSSPIIALPIGKVKEGEQNGDAGNPHFQTGLESFRSIQH
jgi:hypothetical protein